MFLKFDWNENILVLDWLIFNGIYFYIDYYIFLCKCDILLLNDEIYWFNLFICYVCIEKYFYVIRI